MSREIYNELNTIERKLGDIEKAVQAGKRSISYALKYCGITTTHPYTDSDQEYGTMKYYSDLIKSLANSNAMMFEYTIADGTAYKRTVVLPINFDSGYTATNLNDIGDEIVVANIENDLNRLSKTNIGPLSDNPQGDSEQDHLVSDPFGNVCTDGNYIPSMTEIEQYLDEEQQEELLSAMAALGIEPRPLADDDTIYDYIVDWGDGTTATFTWGGTYEENKAAIWHTYEPGSYDVSISGVFKYISSTRYYNGSTIATNRTSSTNPDMPFSGGYPVDNDGVTMLNNLNYGSAYSLRRVIAWGNTQLENMSYAFCQCRNLDEIPMYNTTNSFENVTDFSYVFTWCSSLKSLPYNKNTDTGLFSNCTKATTFAYAFCYCQGITEEIPDKFIDGCENVTSVAYMFAYSRLNGNLPSGLFKGMTKLTTAECCFASSSGYSVINGDLSEDLFHDCTELTTIYRTFYNCDKITGRITRNMFGHLSKLTTMRQAFYNCTGITGIDPDAFHNLSYSSSSGGFNGRHAFFGCTGITDIPKGLFEGLSGDDLAYTDPDTGEIKYWNDGEDFTALSGRGLCLEDMFAGCTGIKTIPDTIFTNLKVANARGMFGGCTGITSALPSGPTYGDWDSYDTIQKWYGVFGYCTSMEGYSDSIPFELGGLSNRKYSQGQVGKICVSDDGEYKLYEPIDYYNGSKLVNGTPVGIVYADMYLDKSYCIPTLSSGLSRAGTNSADDDTTEENKIHKIFVGALNDTSKYWTQGQTNAEDVLTITNTSTVAVSYSYYYWNSSNVQTKQYQRYNGEAYTRALNQFVVNKGYSDIEDAPLPDGYSYFKVVADTIPEGAEYKDFVITELPDEAAQEAEMVYFIMEEGQHSKYSAFVPQGGTWVDLSDYSYIVNSDRYTAVSYANTYNTTIEYFNPGDCFQPDGADLWDQFVMRDWFNDIITNRIIASGTHTSSTARVMRTGTGYWPCAENSSTGAWACATHTATVSTGSKWNNYYVRPSLALIVET